MNTPRTKADRIDTACYELLEVIDTVERFQAACVGGSLRDADARRRADATMARLCERLRTARNRASPSTLGAVEARKRAGDLLRKLA